MQSAPLATLMDALMEDAVVNMGSADRILQSAARYFASVHGWLPVVSRHRFYRGLSSHGINSETSWMLLGYAMQLAAHTPEASATGDCSQDPLYRRVRRLLIVGDAEMEPCLDLVQARLLLAVYELGHGIRSAVYLTIGACARMALDLGLDRAQTLHDGDATSSLEEERRRVWWGIVILER